MRQAGILAAAGLYVLENNIDQLKTDHDNAALLAKSLSQYKDLQVCENAAQTNMVFVSMDNEILQKLIPFMRTNGVSMCVCSRVRLAR